MVAGSGARAVRSRGVCFGAASRSGFSLRFMIQPSGASRAAKQSLSTRTRHRVSPWPDAARCGFFPRSRNKDTNQATDSVALNRDVGLYESARSETSLHLGRSAALHDAAAAAGRRRQGRQEEEDAGPARRLQEGQKRRGARGPRLLRGDARVAFGRRAHGHRRCAPCRAARGTAPPRACLTRGTACSAAHSVGAPQNRLATEPPWLPTRLAPVSTALCAPTPSAGSG